MDCPTFYRKECLRRRAVASEFAKALDAYLLALAPS